MGRFVRGPLPRPRRRRGSRKALDEDRSRPEDVSRAWENIRGTEPVVLAMLGRSKKARYFLHDRAPLLVRFLKEHAGESSFLPTMLNVLDNETLAVVHRETGRGFEVTISGVADNFQLHVLLEDELIGDPAQGWVVGERPDSEVVARARYPMTREPGGPFEPHQRSEHGAWSTTPGRGFGTRVSPLTSPSSMVCASSCSTRLRTRGNGLRG